MKSNVPSDRTNVLLKALKKHRRKLRDSGPSDAIYFSMDDVRQVLKDREHEKLEEENKVRIQNKQKLIEKVLEENKNTTVSAVGIADILGFDPLKKNSMHEKVEIDYKGVPEKYKKYYEKLIRLKLALEKNATKVDSDLELAWSILKKEADQKKELNDAIDRIFNKTYGICEITHNPISEDRLLAVPFTRYSLEGQKEYERKLAIKKDKQENSVLFGDESGESFGSGYEDSEEE